MGLKIPIDNKQLIDSPYDGSNGSLFEFDPLDTEAFVNDIVNGNPTCYLVSGYRGAGKSSFIKKLESEINSRDKKVLFIHLNFAKHEKRSILLRKLIRNFYLCAEEKKIFETLSAQSKLKDAVDRFAELYERTFYEVSKNTNEKRTTATSTTYRYSTSLKDILFTSAALLSLIAFFIGLDLTKWYSYIPITGSVIWSIAQSITLDKKKVNENVGTTEISKNLFYDDEIAEHYLIEVLKSFRDHIKPVFVLDELDKINDDDLVENLINELKPIMLSGLASFIVVAGQNLYYNYYISQTEDDSPLSSLFSRVHHVPLFSSSQLREFFTKIVNSRMTLSNDENQLLDAFVNYLIFESKRVPRRFIVLIRQNIDWENEKSFIEIKKSIEELNIYSKVVKRIEAIDDQEIATKGYPKAIRDYFNMKLLLRAHYILKSQNLFFTDHEIFSSNDNKKAE